MVEQILSLEERQALLPKINQWRSEHSQFAAEDISPVVHGGYVTATEYDTGYQFYFSAETGEPPDEPSKQSNAPWQLFV